MSMVGHLSGLTCFVAAGGSAYLWSARLFAVQTKAMRLLAGLVLWQVIQLLPVQLLATIQLFGMIDRVSVPALAGLQLSILAASFAYFATRPRPHRPDQEFEARHGSPLPIYVVLSIAVLTLSYLLFAVNQFTSPPDGSDALAYHLPLALRWLQVGSLGIPASKLWWLSLPGNTEIGMMLFLSTGIESSVVLVNCLAFAVLALSTYGLAMWMGGGNRIAAITVTLITASIPIVEFQAFSAYVDLYGTAFIMAAFALFLNAQSRPPGSRPEGDKSKMPPAPMLLISALACGISLGTKPIFCVYGVAYCGLLLFSMFRQRLAGRRSTILAALLVGCGLLLPSVFWFGRAWQATRNPFYPMRVKLGHHILFAGYDPSEITPANFDMNFVRSRIGWFIYPWTEWKSNPGYLLVPYGEGDGLGAAFATFVPLSLVFLFLRSIVLGSSKAERALLLSLAAGFLLWWFALHRVLRFALPLVILGCVLTTPLIAILESGKKRAFGVLLVSSLLATCAISGFVPFHELLGRVRTGQWTRADFYKYPVFIDRLPAGTGVLNYSNLRERNFPLAGKFLTNRVVCNFEIPDELTPAFLQGHGVDYIVEFPETGGRPALQKFYGISLMRTITVQKGEDKLNWNIWAVDKQAMAKLTAKTSTSPTK
jgi:hypothetical protein